MNRKETILKSIKITCGAILAIALAALLGLKYSATAGIITILSIQNTKRETLKTALGRTLAFGCALILAWCCYRLFGYTIGAFGMYLLGFSMICLAAGWTAAIAMDSVLITHFLAEKAMTPELAVNELLLFALGTGIGILLNLHLRPREDEWKQIMDQADEQIRGVVQRMAVRVRSLDRTDYDGSCFVPLDSLLEEAKKLALTNMDNTLRMMSSYELDYVQMRTAQCQVLKNIYRSIRMIAYLPGQAPAIAGFFEQVSREYARTNDVRSLLADLQGLFDAMRDEELPKNRDEFESRAVLFYILKQLEEFLQLKQMFAVRYPSEK